MGNHKFTSIITGDIAGSRRAKAPGNWLEPLKRVLGRFGRAPQDWEIYRGDAFQVEVTDPEEALKAAFHIKAAIKQQRNLDVRMAVGIGRVEHAAPAITERNGEAFINSGSRFDQLKDEKRRLAICSPHPDMDREMDLYLLLASVFMDQWTPHSAEVVAILLEEPGLKQAELAKRLGISQSSVSERLSRARWEELQALDAMYRHKIKTLIA
jgi:hypothetical protein